MSSVSNTSSNSGASNLNSFSKTFRVTGLSGLDTDSMVNKLMQAEKIPYNKLFQKSKALEWKRDAYRDVTSQLKSFESEFFDVLKPSSYMLSQNTFKKFSATSSDNTIITATGGASAATGTHKITINKVATASTSQSSTGITRNIEADTSIASISDALGESFSMQVDGVAKTIRVDTSITDVASLQKAIDEAFGENKLQVTDMDSSASIRLQIKAKDGSGVSKISIGNVSKDALTKLGFGSTSNLSNRLNIGDTLENIKSKLTDPSSLNFDGGGNVRISINGKNFTFSSSTTLSSMISQINADSDAKVNMQYDEVTDKIKFEAKQLGAGNNLDIQEYGSTFLKSIGLAGVQGSSAAELSYTNKKFNIVVDGVAKEITLNGSYTASSLASDIQNQIQSAFSGISVNVGFDADNKLSIGLTGGANTLAIAEPANSADSALASLGIASDYTIGHDAQVVVDGRSITRSSNSITVDGVNYTLLKEGSEQTVNLSVNTDDIYNSIKGFVDKYNDLISKLNSKISEKYDRSYQPLTDDQKENMSESQITKWEEKAKTGLLKNDSIIQKVVYDLRTALQDPVQGVNAGLSNIGITTGTYDEKGKLIIDESKLKAAIAKDPDTVMNLFTKQSDQYSNYSRSYNTEQKAYRYKQEGLMQRVYSIFEDNISTFRDGTGKKGTLLEQAGMVGDGSEIKNVMYDQLNEYTEKLDDMKKTLADKEDSYYKKFSALESAISKMNSQSSWLQSQLGGG